MTTNQIAAQFSMTVGERAAATLSQITGKTWSCEVSAAEVACAEVRVRFRAAEGLEGEFSLDMSKRAAIELARLFTGDTAPPPEITEPADEELEALDELIRTIGGSAATALRSHFGKVELKFTGRAVEAPTPEQCWSITLSTEGVSVTLAVAFSKEILNVAEEQPAVPMAPAQTTQSAMPASLPPHSKPVVPPVNSVTAPASSVVKGAAAVPVNHHAPNQSSKKVHELMRDGNLDLLLDVELAVTLRFGRREMLIKDILELSSGSVIELDRQVSEPVDLLVDRKIIARGEVVIVDGNYGLRVTEVATPEQKIQCLA